jgi:hypothetical protein
MKRRHEHRVIAILQTVLGPEAVHCEVAVPRVAHAIDALIDVGEPSDLWGPLGGLVAHRTLVIEHESRAPSLLKLVTSLAKLAWVTREQWPRLQGPGARCPLLLFLSAGCPRWAVAGQMGFTAGPMPGVYTTTGGLPLEAADVHLRGLPAAPGLSLLKLMPTPRSPEESTASIQRLKEDVTMIQSTRKAVMEAIVTHQIPATAKERRLTVEAVLRKGRQEGRQETLRALLAARILTEDQLADLEAIEDSSELEHRLSAESLVRKGRQSALLAMAAQLLTADQLADLEAIEDPQDLERRLVALLRRH